jgi:hypothetical protein
VKPPALAFPHARNHVSLCPLALYGLSGSLINSTHQQPPDFANLKSGGGPTLLCQNQPPQQQQQPTPPRPQVGEGFAGPSFANTQRSLNRGLPYGSYGYTAQQQPSTTLHDGRISAPPQDLVDNGDASSPDTHVDLIGLIGSIPHEHDQQQYEFCPVNLLVCDLIRQPVKRGTMCVDSCMDCRYFNDLTACNVVHCYCQGCQVNQRCVRTYCIHQDDVQVETLIEMQRVWTQLLVLNKWKEREPQRGSECFYKQPKEGGRTTFQAATVFAPVVNLLDDDDDAAAAVVSNVDYDITLADGRKISGVSAEVCANATAIGILHILILTAIKTGPSR